MPALTQVGDELVDARGEVVVDGLVATRGVEEDDGDGRGHRLVGRGCVHEDPRRSQSLEPSDVGGDGLGAALGDGEHELEPVADRVAHAADDLGEERVRQVGGDQDDEVAAAPRERAGGVVDDVPEFVDGVADPCRDRHRDPAAVLAVHDE